MIGTAIADTANVAVAHHMQDAGNGLAGHDAPVAANLIGTAVADAASDAVMRQMQDVCSEADLEDATFLFCCPITKVGSGLDAMSIL